MQDDSADKSDGIQVSSSITIIPPDPDCTFFAEVVPFEYVPQVINRFTFSWFNTGTLKRRAVDLSPRSGELIKVTNLDELKKTVAFKKTGIHINGKWLRASGFNEG